MQLPRVVIAAVFLVIGALIAIPALTNSSGSGARASSTASASPSPSTSGTGTTPSPSGSTSHKPTKSPTSRPPSTPTTGGTSQPVTASIGSVSCPSRSVRVTIRNTGTQREDFTVVKNDESATVPGTVAAHDSRTLTVKLEEDRRTLVQVDWANQRLESRTLKANCKHAGAAPNKTAPNKLPHTGPDTVLWARAATGVGVMLTGVVIFWYGGIWPRRREQIFAKKSD
ncbi:hypothetical protein [Actinomadura opuntiae]|uniref:hypothetical protein n=1 Tax=Actinomadura sp. OS1-43 TaxID=604315 RepID=UPI00255AEB98|nr:hypothetical protein [Actinomadura sp. OS1-43]MDL4821857.1 hypothetical protein [Actinomadura sp. OS1-43]